MACPKVLGQVVVDVMSYVLAILPTVLLNSFQKPFQRGFFCGDGSISYPYKADIVSGRALMGSVLFIPAAVIAVVETIRYILKRRTSSKSTTSVSYRISSKCSIPIVLVRFYKVFGVFLFGAAVTMALTDVGKYTTGRLRPHFLSVCQPNQLALQNCTSSVYIEDIICTRKSDWKLHNARLSFPSGHASIAVYTATFLVLYLQKRVTWKFTRLAKPCLQVMLALTGIFVALSRISDYMHHWSDVLAGAILGCFVGVLMELYVSRRTKEAKSKQEMKLLYHVVNPGDGPTTDAQF